MKSNHFALPEELVAEIFTFLHPCEVVKTISLVDKNWSEISKHSVTWKEFCENYFLHDTSKSPMESYYQIFQGYVKRYPRCLECFKDVKQAWSKLEQILQKIAPECYKDLQGPLSDEDSKKLSTLDLPIDLECALRIHNGQKHQKRSMGVFGGYSFYDYSVSLHLAGTKEMFAFKNRRSGSDFSYLLPISVCYFNDHSLHFVITRDVQNFKKGEIVKVSKGKLLKYYPSYLSLLQTYAKELEQGKFDVLKDGTINRFPTFADLGSDVTTRGIRVRANALFVPEMSSVDQNEYFFSYRIRISMDEKEDRLYEATLLNRHWVIKDGKGKEDKVSGEGVIGLYPNVKRGFYFEYCSCTNQKTKTGTMGGSFEFKNNWTGEKFHVTVGTFILDVDKCF